MKIRTNFQKIWSVALVLSLTLTSITACGEEGEEKAGVKVGETVSSEYKWINSSIVGSMDENVQTNLKDDFYTAVNRDFLVENENPDLQGMIGPFYSIDDTIFERKSAIVLGTEQKIADAIDLSDSQEALIEHDKEILYSFYASSSDWESRNSYGVDPIMPYIERIEGIKDINDMTEYLLDNDGMNFLLDYAVSISTDQPYIDRDYYTVFLDTSKNLFLGSSDCYLYIDDPNAQGQSGQLCKEVADRYAYYILPRLGYSASETEKLISKCYEYETLLADNMMTAKELMKLDNYSSLDNKYSFDKVKKIEGNYPLTKLLEHYGLDKSDSYTI